MRKTAIITRLSDPVASTSPTCLQELIQHRCWSWTNIMGLRWPRGKYTAEQVVNKLREAEGFLRKAIRWLRYIGGLE